MPPANDNVADAIELVGVSGSVGVDLTGATAESGETPFYSNTVWYKFTATQKCRITLRTDSTPLPLWDTVIEYYTGPESATDYSDLTFVDSADEGATQPGADYGTTYLFFVAEPGQTYYFAIWSYDDDPQRSDGVLTWTLEFAESDPVTTTGSDDLSQAMLIAAVDWDDNSLAVRLTRMKYDGTVEELHRDVIGAGDPRLQGVPSDKGVVGCFLNWITPYKALIEVQLDFPTGYTITAPTPTNLLALVHISSDVTSFTIGDLYPINEFSLAPVNSTGRDIFRIGPIIDDDHLLAYGWDEARLPDYVDVLRVMDVSGETPFEAWNVTLSNFPDTAGVFDVILPPDGRFVDGKLLVTNQSMFPDTVSYLTIDMEAQTLVYTPVATQDFYEPAGNGNLIQPLFTINGDHSAQVSSTTYVGHDYLDEYVDFKIPRYEWMYTFDVTSGFTSAVKVGFVGGNYVSTYGGDEWFKAPLVVSRGKAATLLARLGVLEDAQLAVVTAELSDENVLGAVQTHLIEKGFDETVEPYAAWFYARTLRDISNGWFAAWGRWDGVAPGPSIYAAVVLDSGAIVGPVLVDDFSDMTSGTGDVQVLVVGPTTPWPMTGTIGRIRTTFWRPRA